MADGDVAKQYYGAGHDDDDLVADERERGGAERDHPEREPAKKVLMSPKSKGKQQQQALEKLRQRLKDSEEEKALLSEAVEVAKQQTEVVRKKLHNAIRKGKAIEAEKKEQRGELEDLRQRLSSSEKGEGGNEQGEGRSISSLEEQLASAKESADHWKDKAEETSAKVARLEAQATQAGDKDKEEATGDLDKELARLTKENKSLSQKMKLEAAMKEGALKEFSDKLEEKESANVSLKQEMNALQAAMRSAAERVADATAAESRASEEQETQKGQAKKLQRRIAELEGQLKIAGEQEEDQQRVFNETLNLRTEKDELESEKLHLENDNKTKQELLHQVEETLEGVQEECIRLTHIAEQTKAEAKQELELKESELAQVKSLAEGEVTAALEKEALATEREEKAIQSMQEMTQTLQTYRLDEEDRKKKFSRLQGQFTAELDQAGAEIESLKQELQDQERLVDEYKTKQAEGGATGSNNNEEDNHNNASLQEDQLKSALLAATEPLSEKIDEYRLKAEETEQQLKGARQKNMELAASLAQMEISASSHLKVEESVGVYKDTIDQARGREATLQQQVDDLLYERDSLKRANEKLIAGDSVASSSEIKLMKEQLEEAQMLKIQAEDSTRKVKHLQKENKDLRWQIAMASPDDSIKVDIPKHLDSKHLQQPKGALALIVKHRKYILIGYLLLLHFTVYFALTHHSHNRTAVHHSPIPNRG